MKRRHSSSFSQLCFYVFVAVNSLVLLINIIAIESQSNLVVVEIETLTERFTIVEKIDWHDYKFMLAESLRKGPGEQGAPIHLTNPADIEKNKLEQEKEGFNAIVSELISVNRSLPDIRLEACKSRKYLQNLPKTSVIVIFYNENWSLLLRCLHSIHNRTPPELLHEIVLMNDNSTEENLYYPLESYVAENFGEKVKVVRNRERKGLIVTRMEGARIATGEAIVFLDSHMEVNVNWLPPLLEPIRENPNTATVPIIDSFSPFTLQYEQPLGHGTRGGFDWTLEYKWIFRHHLENDKRDDPFPLGVMTGGAYAIRKDYFFELGGYDEGLFIWNGENFELSFKLGLCGGQLLECPCSHVVHLSKTRAKYREQDYGFDFGAKNLKRVATVWMDEYADILFKTDPERYKIDIGDISKQLEFKKKMQCKPFSYFLEKVVPEILERYPLHEWQKFAEGAIYSKANPELCISYLDKGFDYPLGLTFCSYNKSDPYQNQRFTFSWARQIKFNGHCLDASNINLHGCHYSFGNQLWKYNITSNQIQHIPINECISANIETRELKLVQCNASDLNQKFSWSYVNLTAFQNWETVGVKLPSNP